MTPMRELLARRLCAEIATRTGTEAGYDDLSDAARQQWLELADAALEVMMTPTEGMVDAIEPFDDLLGLSNRGVDSYTTGVRAAREGR